MNIKKSMKILITLLITSFIFTTLSYAGLINYERRLKNLKKKAGTTDTILAKWMKKLPRVDRRIRRYDVNRDGVLQTAEVKIFLRDVVEDIDLRGGFFVNTDILLEYDKNKDKVIDRDEVGLIKKHLKF